MSAEDATAAVVAAVGRLSLEERSETAAACRGTAKSGLRCRVAVGLNAAGYCSAHAMQASPEKRADPLGFGDPASGGQEGSGISEEVDTSATLVAAATPADLAAMSDPMSTQGKMLQHFTQQMQQYLQQQLLAQEKKQEQFIQQVAQQAAQQAVQQAMQLMATQLPQMMMQHLPQLVPHVMPRVEEAVNRRVGTVQAEVKALQEQVNSTAAHLTEVQKQVADMPHALRDLGHKVGQQADAATTLNARLMEMERQIASLRKELEGRGAGTATRPVSYAEAAGGAAWGQRQTSGGLGEGGQRGVSAEDKLWFSAEGLASLVPDIQGKSGLQLARIIQERILAKMTDIKGEPLTDIRITSVRQFQVGPEGRRTLRVIFKVESEMAAAAIRSAKGAYHKAQNSGPQSRVWVNEYLTREELERKRATEATFKDRISQARAQGATEHRAMMQWRRDRLFFRVGPNFVEASLGEAPGPQDQRGSKTPPRGVMNMES